MITEVEDCALWEKIKVQSSKMLLCSMRIYTEQKDGIVR